MVNDKKSLSNMLYVVCIWEEEKGRYKTYVVTPVTTPITVANLATVTKLFARLVRELIFALLLIELPLQKQASLMISTVM